MSEVLRVERDDAIARVTLNRPGVRNAFNAELIASLLSTFEALAAEPPAALRAVVLAGEGKAFCAGADIEWQRASIGLSMEENEADAGRLQEMLVAIDECPVPVIAAVHGAALGGGMALCCVADITVATPDATFGFTEVKLGLMPAVISPFVLPRIGESAARALFVTGERFGAERALRIGLLSEVLPDQAALDARVEALLGEILSAGPEATRNAKAVIRDQRGLSRSDALRLPVERAARQRISAEGQEGLKAFLDKRRPTWREE
ncbi:MAG: enoyl-CoA hydratase/isomerase family protein [Chloroflexi bacterium]|nr:enoyl-CoA hydratase/isomerase family protein [Chloroflexota bacterium]